MDPSPVDPVAVQLRRRVAVPPARSLSVHRGHTRREYPGSRLRGRRHREAGRGGSTPSPVPVAWPTFEIRPWRSKRSWPWPPDERSPAWRVGAWFASVTATWAGDVRMQPAVAVELMEYRRYGLADMLSGRYLREARLGLELLPASRRPSRSALTSAASGCRLRETAATRRRCGSSSPQAARALRHAWAGSWT